MKDLFAQRTLLLLLFMLCSASIALAGYQPVWGEYFSGGTYDQTWTDMVVGGDPGTFNIVSSDDYYAAGLVFPNPSGDNYALRCDVVSVNHGTRGMVAGENTWTEYMVSIQMFVNIDETYRHDTQLMGRTDVTAPSWGSGVKFGYFTQDYWGAPVPCWGMRKSYDGPDPFTSDTLGDHGWHRLTMVFSGNHVDAYLDKSYEEIVNDINASNPPYLQSDYDVNPHPSAGGIGFYGVYMIMPENKPDGSPLYVDDIEVYLPPYELPPVPTPSPTPCQIVFDFIPDSDGWTTGCAPLFFSTPEFTWEPGYLKMASQTNTNTFGYWQSPPGAVPVNADYLYRARFRVLTDITEKSIVPQMRLRANSSNLQQYDVLSIESAGDGGASPVPEGRDYDLYFVPPANDADALLAFDLLNFNPDDAAVAELALDSVTVDRFALDSFPTPTIIRNYTFDVTTDGWTTGGVPTVFSPPDYRHSDGALELRTTTNTNTFGFWVNNPADIMIEADKLYRGISEVRTDVTNPALVPEMWLRFNAGNFQAAKIFGITSIGDAANSPVTTNTVYNRLYFLPPASCVGENLIVSFDILNFNPDDAAEASLILDRATIEALQVPSTP